MASILQSDRVQVNNRWVHCDGSNIGFLNTGGGWGWYLNSSQQVWTGAYGWLHDYYARRSTILGVGPYRLTGNCGNIYNSVDHEIYDTGDGQHRTRRYGGATNCNCK